MVLDDEIIGLRSRLDRLQRSLRFIDEPVATALINGVIADMEARIAGRGRPTAAGWRGRQDALIIGTGTARMPVPSAEPTTAPGVGDQKGILRMAVSIFQLPVKDTVPLTSIVAGRFL
jgi:hypothetical protein